MQTDLSKVKFLVGNENNIFNAINTPALPMFADCIVQFLADLSRELLGYSEAKGFVDIISYAYWIRKASLVKEKEKYTDREYRIGRGVALHIAPSNVPVNFAVSMTSSLLAGNITIIRVSNKEFDQVRIICDAINKLLKCSHSEMTRYITIVRYDHDEDITGFLSSMCDIRIIWGGNRTIEAVRKALIPPRAIEMTFADRHSVALINADVYLNEDYKNVAKGVYTDTYYSDQNACSSPRLVVWLGKNESIKKARNIFWSELLSLVDKEYDMKPIQAVDKYTSFCDLAMGRNGVHILSENNRLVRVEVNRLTEDLLDYKNSGGLFYEYVASEIDEICPVLTKQCQTIATLGVEKREILNLVMKKGVRGVDRIVALGQTMGLEFVWDGYRMIENMTRIIYMEV